MTSLTDFDRVENFPVIPHTVNNLVVYQRSDDGYINATALAKAYKSVSGKRRDASEWLTNKRAIQSIDHLSSVTGIPVTHLVQVIQGGVPEKQGIFIHPRLAVRFGIWLSDEFGYLVEQWVQEWASQLLVRSKLAEIEQKLEGALQAIATLQSHTLPDTSDSPPPGWDSAVWADLPPQDKRHFRYLWRRRKFRPSNHHSDSLSLSPSTEEMRQRQRDEVAGIVGEIDPVEQQRLESAKQEMLSKFWEGQKQ